MNLLTRVLIVSTVIVLAGCGVHASDLKTAQAYCMDKTGSSLLKRVWDSSFLGEQGFVCYKGDDKLVYYSKAREYLINKELDK